MRGFLVLAALALGACKPKDEVTGSPEPPASFGALAKTRGCPKLAGAYVWPPVEGAPQGYTEGGIPDPRQSPDFFGLNIQREGVLEIQDADEPRAHLQITSRPQVMDRQGMQARRVTSRRFLDNQYHCKDGWIVTAAYNHPAMAAARNGAPLGMGAKLAPLADGDLAIGQWTRIDSGKHSLFPWGDSGSRGNWIPGTDQVTWYWSRYKRVSP